MYSALIADDEKVIRDGLSRVIPWDELGFVLKGSASCYEDAVDIIETMQIDLLLTDIRMPGRDGIELLEYVKKNSPKTKAVVISGYDYFDYAKDALKAGAVDYILKPIKKREVIKSICNVKEMLDAEYRSDENLAKYQRSYFVRKLLENSFSSSEELEEIRMRLELPESENGRFVVMAVDLYGEDESSVNEARKSCSSYPSEEIGHLLVVILPEEDAHTIHTGIQKTSFGSSQTFDSLSISYEKAVESIRHDGDGAIHSFYPTFSDHKNAMEILDSLAMGAYDRAGSLVSSNMDRFEDVSAEKHWCLWLMDLIEQSFEKYRFTGKYQEAVKNSQSENTGELKEIFMRYMEKVYKTFEERQLSSSEKVVEDAKAIINENLSNKNFSMTMLADRLSISYGYLSGIFKQNTGMNFTSYLLEQRMKKAKSLMETKRLKLYEVSDICGYTNYRYFSETFHKFWGTNPSDFQSQK